MISKLYKYKTINLFFALLITEHIVRSVIWNLLNLAFGLKGNETFILNSMLLWNALILSPLFETLIFQYLLQYFLFVKLKLNGIIVVLLSSFIFAISHSYNIVMIIMIFISGLSLNLLFFVILNRNGNQNLKAAYLTTALYHFILNGIVILLVYLETTLT